MERTREAEKAEASTRREAAVEIDHLQGRSDAVTYTDDCKHPKLQKLKDKLRIARPPRP
jgi:hypothetical protein